MRWFGWVAVPALALGVASACSSDDDDGDCADISGTWEVQNQCIGGEVT